MAVIDRVYAAGDPQYWQGGPNSAPPNGLFTGIGIGCVVSAVVWSALFLGLRDRRVAPKGESDRA